LEIVLAGVKRHQESELFHHIAVYLYPGVHEMLATILGE
jgi:hypothetical protein